MRALVLAVIPVAGALLAAVSLGAPAVARGQQAPVVQATAALATSTTAPSATVVPTATPGRDTSPPQTSTPEAPATPAATPEPHSMEVRGDDECRSQTTQALDLLRDMAPDHYAVVDQFIGVIQCTEDGSGILVSEAPPRFRAGADTRRAGAVWYASTIAHDAYHSKLFHDYRIAYPRERIPNDVWTGREAEAKCLTFQYDALVLLAAPPTTLEYLQRVLDTEYWNIPPADRRW